MGIGFISCHEDVAIPFYTLKYFKKKKKRIFADILLASGWKQICVMVVQTWTIQYSVSEESMNITDVEQMIITKMKKKFGKV